MVSFWEREARIWRIAPENGEDTEGQRNQLVGRVLIPVRLSFLISLPLKLFLKHFD